MTNTETPSMPLTIKEQLMDLRKGGSILLSSKNRRSYATEASEINSTVKRQIFTIRTDPHTDEIRVWRLK